MRHSKESLSWIALSDTVGRNTRSARYFRRWGPAYSQSHRVTPEQRRALENLSAWFKKAGYGTPGVLAALHSWGSNLWLHPHIHCIVTGGGLADDEKRWNHCPEGWLLDVHELSREFRRRFLRLLKRQRRHFASAPVDLAALISTEEQRDWVVYCKPPARDAERVVGYLAGYAFRTAIGNKRILEVGAGQVTIDCKNYHKEDDNGIPEHTPLTIGGIEFIRRFMMHILPDSFKRVRCYGIWAGTCKERKLAAARNYLPEPLVLESPGEPAAANTPEIPDRCVCPKCGALLRPGRHIMPVRAAPVVMPFRAQEGHCHAA